MGKTEDLIQLLNVAFDSDHFEIRFGNFAEDEALIMVAYIGLGENCFHLQWSSEHSLSDEQTIEVTRNIEFYLKERTLQQLRPLDCQEIWEYMVYHATATAANVYGNIHWALVKPTIGSDGDPEPDK